MFATTLEKWETEVKKEASEEAYEKGIEQGLEKGLKKGIEKGREEEKEVLTKTMLENGADIAFVAKITGYSTEFLKKLNKRASVV